MTPEGKKKKEGFPVNGIDTLLSQGPFRSSGSECRSRMQEKELTFFFLTTVTSVYQ